MKTFALASLLLAFATPSFAGAPVLGETPKAYIFEVDARPVDGALERVTIVKAKDGTYSAKYKVTTSGFGSPVQTTVTKLAKGLECVELRPDDSLWELKCSIDNRPADGFLTEVIATRNEEGRYDVVLHKSAWSMIDGSEFHETTEIAFNLELK